MRLRFDLIFAAFAASFVLLLFAVAQAQTGTAAPASDLATVPVWPKAALALPEQPVAASFNLGQIEGVAPQLISGVTAKGYARKVAVENQTIGQVLVMSVAKGDREETISTEGLTAQFDAGETSQLFPEKTVEVKGSKAALIAALERLAAPVKKEEEKKQTDSVSDNPTSSGGKSNNEASSYKTPTVAAAPAQEPDPVVDVRTTKDGCPVRIDIAQEKAIPQSKTQTFTDGALSGEGKCSDAEMGYQLKKSYPSCPVDDVAFEAMTAWPQFSWYYVDDAGETHSIGECAKDEDTAYTITEDEEKCPISLDFTAKQAVPQATFVYIGRNNALTQVPGHGCAPSTKTAAVTLDENKANCTLRPDYVTNRSYELSMWTYVLKGVTYQAAPCTDTGRSFPHDIIYADAAGNYICPAIPNTVTKKVTLQSRRQITIDGVQQWVNECTPDTINQDILATTNTCMDPSKWTHDLDANLSYGQERFYYKKVDGTPEYVTPCQKSTVTYPHDVTVTGYQNHDDQLWAYPLSTVKITVNGAPYPVASSEVLPGASQMIYLLDGTEDQPSGASIHDGCNTYRETIRYERWKRPDGTIYLKAIGTGQPIGPTYNCITETWNRYLSGSHPSGDVTYGTSTIQSRLRYINRDTNTVVSQGPWEYVSSDGAPGYVSANPPSGYSSCYAALPYLLNGMSNNCCAVKTLTTPATACGGL